jgi:hypothetical protein
MAYKMAYNIDISNADSARIKHHLSHYACVLHYIKFEQFHVDRRPLGQKISPTRPDWDKTCSWIHQFEYPFEKETD